MSTSRPEYLQQGVTNNYEQISTVTGEKFPKHGQDDNYVIDIPRSFGKEAFSIREAVATLCESTSDTVYGVDLGTGIGTVPKTLNATFENVSVIGITAEDATRQPDSYIVYGNIEDLPNIGISDKKYDFFCSSHAFPYLGDPLKVISDAYGMLNEGGFLFLNHVYINLPNLSDNFFQYLRNQGYDIIAGQNDNKFSWGGGVWGPGYVFIRKNNLDSLAFPVEYDGCKTTPIEYKPILREGDLYYPPMVVGYERINIQYVAYKLQADLVSDVDAAKPLEDVSAYNVKRLQEWGFFQARKTEISKPMPVSIYESKMTPKTMSAEETEKLRRNYRNTKQQQKAEALSRTKPTDKRNSEEGCFAGGLFAGLFKSNLQREESKVALYSRRIL